MPHRLMRAASAVALVLLGASSAGAQVVYDNDFNGASTANLSATGGGVSILAPFAGCFSPTYCTPYLGRANGTPFDNHTLTLSLAGLPAHSAATVDFSLLVLATWDGNGGPGPDFIVLGADGSELFRTTFNNFFNDSRGQSYPGPFPTSNAALTGADGGALGITSSVYEISTSFAHTGGTLAFSIAGEGLQGWGDEGWGLDNLRVTLVPTAPAVVPEPGTWALLATGLAGLVGVAYRRRRG